MTLTTIIEANLTNVVGTDVKLGEKLVGKVLTYNPATGQATLEINDTDAIANMFTIQAMGRYVRNEKKSRCCGRCDGHNDECVADQICDDHKVQGCETCFGKR